MTWEQKIQACQALGPELSLKMRSPGDWYVSQQSVDRKEGGFLSGGKTSGKTPEDAVNQYWDWLTNPAFYVITYYSGERKAMRWNGYMWVHMDEKVMGAA